MSRKTVKVDGDLGMYQLFLPQTEIPFPFLSLLLSLYIYHSCLLRCAA
jgi:hypothetical protein